MNLTQIEGLISPGEAEALAELAKQLPLEAQTIVEIGSYTGKSAINLATAAPEAQIYCIDLWDMRLPGESDKKRLRKKYKFSFNGSDTFKQFTKRTAQFSNLTWIKGASSEIAKAWSRDIGLLFIDGAHDLVNVTADYAGWSPFVVNGGWIAFHDSSGKGVKPVIKAAEESPEWTGWQRIERLTIARRLISQMEAYPLE